MKLKIFYKNVMSEIIGENNGISKEDLLALQDKVGQIHDKIKEYREKQIVGFMDLPYDTNLSKRIRALGESIRDDFENFVVIGIGGSALGNIALHTALNSPIHNLKNKPKFFVLDNVDPEKTVAILNHLNLKKTLFNVITKSGGTAETMSNFMIVKDYLQKELGDEYNKHIIATTDPEKGLLRKLAKEEDFATLPIPDNVGGRFSILTAVGLLSASVLGMDIDKILEGAASVDKKCQTENIMENPAYLLGGIHYLLNKKNKNINVMMPYSNALYDFADWYRQLWAESLGKSKTLSNEDTIVGITPVKALGTIDQHSQVQLYVEGPNDKLITFLRVEKFKNDITIPNLYSDIDSLNYLNGKKMSELLNAEQLATQYALTTHKRPNYTIIFPEVSEETIGEFIYLMEMKTMFTGFLYDINPFDQPGVEWGKKATYGMMGRKGYEEYKISTEYDINYMFESE